MKYPTLVLRDQTKTRDIYCQPLSLSLFEKIEDLSPNQERRILDFLSKDVC